MSRPVVYLGLDVAQTTGIAYYSGDSAKVTDVKGYPYNQFKLIARLIRKRLEYDEEVVVVMEQPVHFQNAKTTRDLLQRYGYLKWSLLHTGCKVLEVNLNSVRSFLKCRTKQSVFELMLDFYVGSRLTDDMTDALACCLYQAHIDGKLELPIIPQIDDWSE